MAGDLVMLRVLVPRPDAAHVMGLLIQDGRAVLIDDASRLHDEVVRLRGQVERLRKYERVAYAAGQT